MKALSFGPCKESILCWLSVSLCGKWYVIARNEIRKTLDILEFCGMFFNELYDYIYMIAGKFNTLITKY